MTRKKITYRIRVFNPNTMQEIHSSTTKDPFKLKRLVEEFQNSGFMVSYATLVNGKMKYWHEENPEDINRLVRELIR